MAGLKMSFMDALRVAAQTKEAPKEWASLENSNTPSWPASLSELARSSSVPQKRSRDDREGTSTHSSSSPSTPVISGLPGPPFPSSPLKSHSSPLLGPSAFSMQCTPSQPRLGVDGGMTTPTRGSHLLDTLQRFPSIPTPSPRAEPPSSKRRRSSEARWISTVAGSIRGPWTGERSAAEDEVVSNLLSRTPSLADNLGGNPSDMADAIKAKLKENLLQRVFENRELLQKTLFSLPDIMKWGSQILSTHNSGAREASLSRPQADPRKPASPAISSGDSNHAGNSSLISSSAIQKCVMAVPPIRAPFPSSQVTQPVPTSAFAGSKRTQALKASSNPGLDSILSESALSKCLAAAPPRGPQQAPNSLNKTRIESYHGALQWFSSAQEPTKSSSRGSMEGNQGFPVGQPKAEDYRSEDCEDENNGGMKPLRSFDQGSSGSWGPPAAATAREAQVSREYDPIIDDLWLQEPAENDKGTGAPGSNGMASPDGQQHVLDLAAACMSSLTQLIDNRGKTTPMQSMTGNLPAELKAWTMPRGSQLQQHQQGQKPTPLLVDAEALANICPDAVANIFGGKSPVGEFHWEGDLPTPNVTMDGDEDIWAAAFKAELPSPNNGGAPAW